MPNLGLPSGIPTAPTSSGGSTTTTTSGGSTSGSTAPCNPLTDKNCLGGAGESAPTTGGAVGGATASAIVTAKPPVVTPPLTSPTPPTLVTPIVYAGGYGGGGSPSPSVAKQIEDAKAVSDMVEPKIFGIPQKYVLIGGALAVGYLFMSGKIKL